MEIENEKLGLKEAFGYLRLNAVSKRSIEQTEERKKEILDTQGWTEVSEKELDEREEMWKFYYEKAIRGNTMEEIKVDDSFVRDEDKKILLLHLKKMYAKKFEWADMNLVKVLMMHHYEEVITGINKDEYLLEIKRDLSTMDMLHNLS